MSRRFFLRGAGASLALPALPSLVGSLLSVRGLGTEIKGAPVGAAPAQARRFCCIFFPNGVSLPPKNHPLHNEWH